MTTKGTPFKGDIELSSEKKVKYPFSGFATNLIDKFLVLGYDQKVIDHTFNFMQMDEDLINKELKTRFKFFEFEERPSIINEICNDYTKDLLENDLILELIFPNMPQMYFLEKQYTKKEGDEELLTSAYSIIFSINPQDNSGSKKSYNGLGYIFYAGVEYKREDRNVDGTLYIPFTYVILSEYPYFYHYKEICRQVYKQKRMEHDEMPIEIILYNIVKYLQSPINKSINLTFAAPLNLPIKDKGDNLTNILYPLYSLSQDENRIPTMFFPQLSGYPFMDINISFLFNLIPPEIIIEVFIFSFLEHDIIFYSARPEILNMVMYIFSNLNYPFNDSIYYWHILSVSKDSFMNGSSTFVGKTCSTLTGILDEYDKDLLTTSKIREHFVLDIDNKNFFFLFQEETEDVKDTIALYTYIKNCAQIVEETTNETIKIDKETKIKNYFNDKIQLYEAISNLMDELNRRSKKVTSINYNERKIKPSFLTLYEDESEMECTEANLRLQKAFFTFITQITQNFVKILFVENEKNNDELSLSRSMTGINGINDEEEEKKKKLAAKAGIIFKKKFRDCSKYSSFVINFNQYHDTIDLYKIPYNFINEFIYYSNVAVKNNLSEVDVFRLIDQFYGKRKLISFKEIIKNSEEKPEKKEKNKKKENKNEIKEEKESLVEETDIMNIYSFNFNKFIDFYKEHLRALINREQDDDKEIFFKVKVGKNGKIFKRNSFYLSNKILNIYANISNNNYETFTKLFRLIKCSKKKEENINEINLNMEKSNDIKLLNHEKEEISFSEIINNKKITKLEKNLKIYGSYEFTEITDVIERHFILERCFTSYGLIKFSLLNILAITRGLEKQIISDTKIMETLCDFCNTTKSLVRKYMNIFLNVFRGLYSDSKIKNPKDIITIIENFFKESYMTEETKIALNTFNKKQEGEAGPLIQEEDQAKINEYIKKYGKFFDKNKMFEEIMKTIETIFTGMYNKNFLKDLFKKIIQKNKNIWPGSSKDEKNFELKTPLDLYQSSNSLLNKYINNNFNNKKEDFNEIISDILSLLFYFKLPTIRGKWVDHYKKEEEKITPNKIIKEKGNKKKEQKNEKIEEENLESKELEGQILTIIAILFNIFESANEHLKNLK